MRSFIKSHRKANSLDESPSSTHLSPGRNGDNVAFQRPLDEPFTFDPPTPSQLGQNTSGSKYSPGFESFHKLANKKMFTSKLFKKSSSSNTITQSTTSHVSQKEITSAPGTPQSRNSGSDFSLSHEEVRKLPAIKGTITHNWGDQSRSQQPVIKLNSQAGSNNGCLQDLEPAVRIASLRRDSAISAFTTSSYENNVPSTASTDENSLHQVQRDRHVYTELSKVKSKNRQARIHSHDDMIHFEKMSTVSIELLASTVSPNIQAEDNKGKDDEAQEVSGMDRLNVVNERIQDGILASASSTIDQRSPCVTFEDTPTHERRKSSDADSEDDDVSYLLTPDIDEDEDDSSRFSFELSGLNGRTSSVKYYSKPDPAEAVYIDDIYGEDNFDDEMNLYEDSYDDMEFPSNSFHVTEDDSESASDETGINGTIESSQNIPKTIKKYNDLFDLSDEDEVENEEEDKDEDEGEDEDEDEDEDEVGPYSEIPADTTHEYVKQGVLEGGLQDQSSQGLELTNRSESSVLEFGKAQPKGNSAAKPVKSFSDIFDIDDDDDDDNDDDNYDDYLDDNYDNDYDNENDYSRHYSGDTKKDLIKDVDSYSAAGRVKNDDGGKALVKNNPRLLSPITASRDSLNYSNPVHILVTSPTDPSSKSVTIADPHLDSAACSPSLPPPARSQTLKIHDLNSNLDSEIPGMMSNLYFINESEEDEYNERSKIQDDDYLDEINTVPEDFDFSDKEQELKTPLRRSAKGSFRSTHSYSSQPTGTAKENTPTRNKLEIKNKTVTFFDHPWDRSPVDRSTQKSPQPPGIIHASPKDATDDYFIPLTQEDGEVYNPVTPANSFSKPTPEYLNDFSLSPIQENTSSVDNSPTLSVR